MTDDWLNLNLTELRTLHRNTLAELAYSSGKVSQQQAELEAMRSEHRGTLAQLTGSQRALSAVMVEHTETVAELAALRPWAEAGRKAVREQWWWNAGRLPGGIDILALLAQLEAEHARSTTEMVSEQAS